MAIIRHLFAALVVLAGAGPPRAQDGPPPLLAVRTWVLEQRLTALVWHEEEALRGLAVASRALRADGSDLRGFVQEPGWSGHSTTLVEALRQLEPRKPGDRHVADALEADSETSSHPGTELRLPRHVHPVDACLAVLECSGRTADAELRRFEDFADEHPGLLGPWRDLGALLAGLARWEVGDAPLDPDAAALVVQWDPDPDRRLLAARVLGDVEASPRRRAAIARAIGDGDDQVAREALIALQRWGVERDDEVSVLAAAATQGRQDLRALAETCAEGLPAHFEWERRKGWEAAVRTAGAGRVRSVDGVWIVSEADLWVWGLQLGRGRLPVESVRRPIAHVRIPDETISALWSARAGGLAIVAVQGAAVARVSDLYRGLYPAWSAGDRRFRIHVLEDGAAREQVVYVTRW